MKLVGLLTILLLRSHALAKTWTITVKSPIGIDGKPINSPVEYDIDDLNLTQAKNGNFGKVLKAFDKNTGKYVAVKYAQFSNNMDPQQGSITLFHDNEFGGYQHLHRKMTEFKFPQDGFPTVFLKGLANKEEDGESIYPVIVLTYYSWNLDRDLGLEANRAPWEYLPIEDFVRYCQQMFQILKVLKKCEIIHRDLKPDNFMVDENGKLRLVDFGFALYPGTVLGTKLCGTLPYLMRSDFDDYQGPNSKHDFTSFVCMMPVLVLGNNGVDEVLKSMNPQLPSTDEAKYRGYGEQWRVPYYRSRYDEVFKKAFELTEPEIYSKLGEVALNIYNATESKNEVDYKSFSNEFDSISKKFIDKKVSRKWFSCFGTA